MSEIGLANTGCMCSHSCKALANPQLAETIRATNPVRAQYTTFANSNPLMKPVAEAAEKVRANRHPVAEDNPFLKMQEQAASAIIAGFNAFRDWRDKAQEQKLFAIFGSPVVQAALGVGEGVFEPRAAARQDAGGARRRGRDARGLPRRHRQGRTRRGEAPVRCFTFSEADRSFDERSGLRDPDCRARPLRAADRRDEDDRAGDRPSHSNSIAITQCVRWRRWPPPPKKRRGLLTEVADDRRRRGNADAGNRKTNANGGGHASASQRS